MCEVKPGKTSADADGERPGQNTERERERNDEAFVVQTIKTFSDGSKKYCSKLKDEP